MTTTAVADLSSRSPLYRLLLRRFFLRAQAQQQRVRAGLRWWAFGDRRHIDSDLAYIASELRRLGPPDEDLQEVLGQALHRAWCAYREQNAPGRNPYGPDCLADLEQASHHVANAALNTALWDDSHPAPPVVGHGPVLPSQVPGLADRITAQAVIDYVQPRVAAVTRLAGDPRFLTRDHPGGFVVQHQATGLRAKFTLRAGGLGGVVAKPFVVPSIDPDPPHRGDWDGYTRLGIGRRLYLHAAHHAPTVRWAVYGGLNDASLGLRRVLHAEDPWRWQDPDCDWCRTLPGGWAETTDFATHPHS